MDLGIEGNAAITIASSSGLGKACAKKLAEENVNVIVNGRDTDRLEATVEELDAVGSGRVVGQQGDITNTADIEAIVDTAVEEFGVIDHVITSAGGPPYGTFMTQSDEDWYHAFDMLVMGVVRLLRYAEPHLRSDGGGTIVNITSITVKEAVDELVLSNSVRMSVIGLEKTLSREFAPDVRSNAILTGYFETQRLQDGLEHDVETGEYDSYEDALDSLAANVPLDRVGDPEELADLAVFLSSERASYINGTAIPAGGGVLNSNL